MRRLRLSVRVALAVSVLALLLLVAAATTVGYLIEAHSQRADRERRLAAVAAYVEHDGQSQLQTTQWQQGLARQVAAFRLSATLTMIGPTSKRRLYANVSEPVGDATDPSSRRSTDGASANSRSSAGAASPTSAAAQPTASYIFPLARGSENQLALDLYARPMDANRRLLVALASGLAALLAGVTLLIWATGRWLAAPLHRLNMQVDAIAGGDPIQTRTTSPLREVENIATAVAGMAARLAQTAEQDATLETERRLLLGSIAHDLRTPLFSLRGYLDAIASGIGDPRERLDQARAKAQQIDRLVTGLFNYTRAEIDARPPLQTTDLAKAVTQATSGFDLAADEHQIELRVHARAGTTVKIDRDAFERALANIIDNALRHTPRGGAIDVTSGEDADSAYVCVIDDGPGIAPDLLPRVFEPMVRADSTRNSHTGGAGLGLSIAARLLQNQGGTIHATNAPGRGANLTLRLPRTSRSPDSADVQEHQVPPSPEMTAVQDEPNHREVDHR